jgi:hypothetical protein
MGESMIGFKVVKLCLASEKSSQPDVSPELLGIRRLQVAIWQFGSANCLSVSKMSDEITVTKQFLITMMQSDLTATFMREIYNLTLTFAVHSPLLCEWVSLLKELTFYSDSAVIFDKIMIIHSNVQVLYRLLNYRQTCTTKWNVSGQLTLN